MKKVLPVLFVLSTAVITIAGLAMSSKGVFRRLNADENSHTYNQTFNADKITSDTAELLIRRDTTRLNLLLKPQLQVALILVATEQRLLEAILSPHNLIPIWLKVTTGAMIMAISL